MASPHRNGYFPFYGINSNDLEILNEDLKIKLVNPTKAYYQVSYNILNQKQADSLALKFAIHQRFAEFEVFLDEESIDLSKMQIEENQDETSKDFVLYLTEGKHTVKVCYYAYPDEDLSSQVTKYIFKYDLEPARHWKSFNNINIEIDATAIDGTVYTQIKDSTIQIKNSEVYKISFDHLPQDLLEIEIDPKVYLPSIISPESFFFLSMVIFVSLNLVWLFKWRKRNVWSKYSLPSIVGSIIVPFVCLCIYIASYDWIDVLIGEHASARHGYTFLVMLAYPFFLAIYFLVAWIIDLMYKDKLRNTFKKKIKTD